MANPTASAAPIPASSAGANSYTDLNALSGLKNNARSPQAIHAIAQQVDALFLQMMLKSMRDASAATSESDSNEMGMYQDMFDKQVALTLSQHQDLGLGSMVTRKLAAAAGPDSPAPVRSLPARSGTALTSPGPAASAPNTSGPAAAGTASGSPAGTGPSAPSADAGAGPPSASVFESAGQFVSEVMPAITRCAQALGVSPLGMLAQAALETGWGRRMARTADGSPSFNLFGMKVGTNWDGARAPAKTLEFSGGAATLQQTAFRAYSSVEESVADFARVLGSSPRYRAALSSGGNPQSYIDSIAQSGYATDPGYADKLHDILRSDTLREALSPRITKL